MVLEIKKWGEVNLSFEKQRFDMILRDEKVFGKSLFDFKQICRWRF